MQGPSIQFLPSGNRVQHVPHQYCLTLICHHNQRWDCEEGDTEAAVVCCVQEGRATCPDSEDRQKRGVCQEGKGPFAALLDSVPSPGRLGQPVASRSLRSPAPA